MDNLKQEFWSRIAKINSVMLGVTGEDRLVAMSPQLHEDLPGHVWFITAKGTDLAKSVAAGEQSAQMVICNDSAGLYGDIDGRLSLSNDHAALDKLWSFVADAWFEEGKEDPDVCLLQFTPHDGEISASSGGGVRFLYEIAKANLTGAKPDAGAHGVVSF